MMQMQAYVACEDEDVRAVVREEFIRLVRFVQSASGGERRRDPAPGSRSAC